MGDSFSLVCSRGGAKLDCYLTDAGTPKGGVVICPGGCYEHCSVREGAPVAQAWTRAGYHAFVLWYDCEPVPLGYGPLRQLAGAVSEVRARAGQWRMDASRVAVCGFSAGGHLAGMLGALWQKHDLFDGGDSVHRRPGALVLGYPVTTAGKDAHRESFERLAGPDVETQQAFSLEKMVDGHMPPTFLWHTMDDESVPVRGTFLLSEALLKNGIAQEVHLFPHGAHGLSLATEDTKDPVAGRIPDAHVARWFELAVEWLDRTL